MEAPPLLTRRGFGLLVSGGLVAAVAAGDGVLGLWRGPLRGRPPDRVEALPPPDLAGTVPLEQALAQRHSVRAFSPVRPTQAELGQLLWAAQGVTRPNGHRTAPSAGALYPLDLYVVAGRELWHYLPAGHRVEQWDVPRDLRGLLRRAALGQAAVSAAPVVVVVTGATARTARRYGDRVSRFVTLEAGHCAQSLLLQATALGLGGVCVGAVTAEAVRRTLGLSRDRTPYYVVPLGHPAA
jgi:SagB-type dehydrogenase family enzyme